MASTPSVELTGAELDALFHALDIWSKIRDVRLTSTEVVRAKRPSRSYPDGVSDIVKHINRAGYHVATTHRITLADGSLPHGHAKDLRVGDIVIWRGEE
jgi:hypothetical protein